jgi:general nucleoside transport system permease protein
MDALLIAGLLAAGIRLAMSIAITALGEVVGQRSGVLNVGVEGIMLFGAFLAALGAVKSGSPWGGLALACLGGLLLGALHGWFAIVQRADQIVSGIAIVILGLGLSSFLFRLTMGTAPSALQAFRAVDLGALSTLPLIGPVLFGQNLLAYLTVLFAIVLWFVLSRTPLGLAIRACGENPEAAEAAGIKVNAVRFGCVLFSGAMAGIGGAYLAIAQINSFVENMVVGRGFIAIACVVFGRWHPIGALAAALGFGITEAAQIRLQTWYPQIPYQFFVMLPYLLAIVALVFMARSAALPRALGRAFVSDRTL